MRSLIAAIKFCLFFIALAAYFLSASVVSLIVRSEYSRRRILTLLVSRFAALTCSLLGIHVYPMGTGQSTTNALIVGNHLSYLDVLVHASLWPSCFVTSVEIKNTPLLGQIARLAGCVFVERRNRENLDIEIASLTENLKHNIPITIFPEATSTNGDAVLRFKKPLFKAAINSKTPIVPTTINYERINHEPVTITNRDIVCWYGDMDFLPHLWQVMNQKRIDVSLRYHKPLSPNSEPEALAASTHEIVSRSFYPFNQSSLNDYEPREIKNQVAINGDA